MRRYKIYILSVIFAGLVALTYWLLIIDNTSPKESFSNVNLGIPASVQPDSIVFVHQKEVNKLISKNGELYINDKYKVKSDLQEAFLLILTQIEVKRPVSKKLRAELLAAMDSAGVLVNMYESGMLVKSIEVWGDKRKEITYVKEPDKEDIYIVTIPGHAVYLGDIFFYNENEWRNNTLFQSTWRSLNKLSVQFPKATSENFSVEFAEDFFYIPELEAFDTTALLDYLETFSNIRIVNYLPQKKWLIDSLLNVKPDLRIKIDDLDTAKSNDLYFYGYDSSANKKEVIVVGKDREPGIVPLESYKKIAKGNKYFSYTGKKK